MRIGFIGTGNMGNPIAANFVKAGYRVLVHDAIPDHSQNLIGMGAEWADGPASVGAVADLVFLSLPSDREVTQVCLGESGLLAHIAEGATLVDLTTVSTEMVHILVGVAAARGVAYVAAPVTQGVDNAALGNLTIFAGGDERVIDAIREPMSHIATMVIHVGTQESAIVAKLLTNLLWFVNAAAIGEALLLGIRGGIRPELLPGIIQQSCGSSWVAEHDVGSIYDGSYDPSFTLKLCNKDLRLIAGAAEALGVPFEVGAVARDMFARATARFGEDGPELSVVRYLEEVASTVIRSDAHRVDGGREMADGGREMADGGREMADRGREVTGLDVGAT